MVTLISLMLIAVQDAIFAEPRLARIYDQWEGDRVDLPHYLAIMGEFGARSVLDVGCGTGNFACLLAEHGFEVVGLDPAAASLDVARGKPGAQQVQWVHCVLLHPAPGVQQHTMIQAATVPPADTTKFAQEPRDLYCAVKSEAMPR
jgi:SAM-dependent methyltransferase